MLQLLLEAGTLKWSTSPEDKQWPAVTKHESALCIVALQPVGMRRANRLSLDGTRSSTPQMPQPPTRFGSAISQLAVSMDNVLAESPPAMSSTRTELPLKYALEFFHIESVAESRSWTWPSRRLVTRSTESRPSFVLPKCNRTHAALLTETISSKTTVCSLTPLKRSPALRPIQA